MANGMTTRLLPVVAGLVLAGLALAGCGSDDRTTGDRTTEVTAADGTTVKLSSDGAGSDGGNFKIESTGADGKVVSTITAAGSGAGASWPKSAPDFAAAYPGARITTVVDGITDGEAGGMATFETDDSPDKVVAFYKARAAAAKLDRVTNMTADAMTMFTAGDEASDRSVMVQVTTADGKTTGAVTFSAGKPG